jgi:hypothetical protein
LIRFSGTLINNVRKFDFQFVGLYFGPLRESSDRRWKEEKERAADQTFSRQKKRRRTELEEKKSVSFGVEI